MESRDDAGEDGGRKANPAAGDSLSDGGGCYAEASPLSQRFQVGGIRGGSMINGWATALSSKGIDGFCGSRGDAHQWGAVELLW